MTWLDLLRADVSATGSKQATADKIGVSRTAVSLALAGRYGADTTRLEAKVLAALANRVACPALGTALARHACAERASRPMPMSSPAELRAWHVCQACPNKPKEGAHAV